MSAPEPRASQAALVRRACVLADELSLRSEHAMGRNVFRALLADFEARPDQDRLRRMLELLLEGSGGHLQRTGGYAEQAEEAAKVILAELRSGELSVGEYRTLFAWTACLLPTKPAKRSRQGPPTPPTPTEPGRLSPFDEKSRAALASFLPKNGDPDRGREGS